MQRDERGTYIVGAAHATYGARYIHRKGGPARGTAPADAMRLLYHRNACLNARSVVDSSITRCSMPAISAKSSMYSVPTA